MEGRNPVYPLTIYYDAACPLCAEEMHVLKAHDAHERLRLIDCSAPQFSEAAMLPAGIDKNILMQRIHARDAAGNWLHGIDVFEAAYRAAGIESMARLWEHPRLRPVWERIYPWVADNRMLLSRLGLTKAFGYCLGLAARQAERRSRLCLERKDCAAGDSAN